MLKGYLMLPKHFRWTVVQLVPIKRHPDKWQQFCFYLHVCDSWMSPYIGWPKIKLIAFSPFHINTHVIFFTKWPPAAILDGWKSHLIVFLAISDKYSTFILLEIFHKMATSGHFGWPKNQSIAFLAISDQYATLILFEFFSQNGRQRLFGWPKITFDRISRHFAFLAFYFVWNLFSPFQINMQPFFKFVNFGSPISVKNNRVLPLGVCYAKYEVDRWIYDKVRATTSFLTIFKQNDRQRPFCFSDWCQKS